MRITFCFHEIDAAGAIKTIGALGNFFFSNIMTIEPPTESKYAPNQSSPDSFQKYVQD
jgi:hypothetical protein